MKRLDHSGLIGPGTSASTVGASTISRAAFRTRLCPAAVLSSDLLAFALATTLAFSVTLATGTPPLLRALTNATALGSAWHGWGTLLVIVSLLCWFSSRGHYTSRVPFWTQAGDAAIAAAVGLTADTFITVFVYSLPVSGEGLLRWVLFCPCLIIMRTGAREALRAAGVWQLDTLIIAGTGIVDEARAALLSDRALGYRLVGSLELEASARLSEDDLLRVIDTRGAEFVVVAVSGTIPAERAVIATLRRARLPIAIVPALDGLPVVGFRQHYFVGHDIVMLVSRNNLARPFSRMLKIAFDQVVAVMLIMLLAPLLGVMAFLVRRDGGPAFYRHRRIGEGGRTFACIKFRTMIANADQVLGRLLATDPDAAAEWRSTQKLRHDPRITRIGQFLRRSSLDELPQLFNVLRGEMSLVGPRPIVQAEVARYGADIEYYYETRPGITGLWQVSGRNDTSYQRRVRLDVWYVRNWTLWHDIAILFKTLPAVFLQRGAL